MPGKAGRELAPALVARSRLCRRLPFRAGSTGIVAQHLAEAGVIVPAVRGRLLRRRARGGKSWQGRAEAGGHLGAAPSIWSIRSSCRRVLVMAASVGSAG
ncbi:hypothetical protein, partial [Mesorhizobium sp. M7A.F.Ca.CA.004.08.2.1]|uniref:hypothetical protein n=1 Tax=Mesorhizobium sp. M7A.F.Ca.CA.004.08.2.1 TaxID=2496731 RepID=UPI001FE0555A